MLTALFDRPWKKLLWFLVVPALAYLPWAFQLTYYRDDWYYAYDAIVGPSGVFRYMFAIDRPARGPFFDLYHALFGVAPLPYHLAMFLWRVAGGLAVIWLCRLLWRKQEQLGLVAGLLFALFPGFTWWVSGIEYQPMVASAALMVVSLALTAQALRMQSSLARWLCVAAAILTGWIYLSLVEYAAGMEVLRFLLVYIALSDSTAKGTARRLTGALQRWVIYLIIPVGFAIWRFVLFTSERRATDLGAQLGGFFASPLTTALHWLVSFLVSAINVTFAAWVEPLKNNFFSGSLRTILLGLLLALLSGSIAWLLMRSEPRAEDACGPSAWIGQAIGLGLAGILLGILPIMIANREISFPNFSHYALPASLGVALMIGGLLFSIADARVRAASFATLVFLSGLTHQGLGAAAAHEERLVANFWHQVAWRAPSIAEGTTLLASYPNLDYADDTDIVWGPANFIYYRGRQAQLPVRVPLAVLPLNTSSLTDILLGRDPLESTYRAHSMTVDYGRVLLMVQSSEDSCVRLIDPQAPTFSLADDPGLRQAAPFSRIDGVQPSGQPPKPPASILGPEPAHTWCYYFEKADLAAQRGNWEEVASLEQQAARLGLHPNDQVEWMPFLLAEAQLGDLQAVKDLSKRINTERLYKDQACTILRAKTAGGLPLVPEMQAEVDSLFCGAKP